MDHYLHALYHAEIDRASLDFDADPQYQAYLSQAEALWPDGELPSVFSNFLIPATFSASPTAFGWGWGWRYGVWEPFAALAASDFSPGGKVTKTPVGNQGFQRLPSPSPEYILLLPARQTGTMLLLAPLPLTWR